jgi:hypothetical protein
MWVRQAFRPLHHGVTNGIYRIVRRASAAWHSRHWIWHWQAWRAARIHRWRPRPFPAPVVSAVNGAFGDYLLRNRNPLAPAHGFFHQHGKPLAMRTAALQAHHTQLSSKLVVFVHGLCCDESAWEMFRKPPLEDNKPYGEQLQALGYTPFLPALQHRHQDQPERAHVVTHAGQSCAAPYPQPIEQIVLIGHSMGRPGLTLGN